MEHAVVFNCITVRAVASLHAGGLVYRDLNANESTLDFVLRVRGSMQRC